MTTNYHYHGEKRKRRDGDRQWKASFRRWINEQMRLIGIKEGKSVKLSEGEIAVKSAHYFMTRPEQLEKQLAQARATHVPVA